jgi:hypothetical protein
MQLFDMDNYSKLKHYQTIIVTPEFVAKFESRVVRDDCMPDGCHIWTGSKNNKGYGTISFNKKSFIASRSSYVIYNGAIPHGMHICHRCDNPPCVNPAHLFLGSQSDNMKDAVAKNRNWNVAKTHCPQGHEYADGNLWKSPTRNSRQCRICIKEKNDKRKLAL